VEFKEAKADYDFRKLGQYFSALCNEANLKQQRAAWLVFGVADNGQVVGTRYRASVQSLASLKEEIANKTSNRITFIDIHEIQHPQGRVLMFEIPPAPKGIPVAFDGHYYGRDGSALAPLNLEEIERIRTQPAIADWSAVIVPDAVLDDLDEQALRVARVNFLSKFPYYAEEAAKWDDITFLNKARLAIKGKLTRTAILLLGKDEAEHLLQPADIKIRWLLKDHLGNDRDYALFGMPLLLAVDKVFAKIRNLKYRYLPEGTLFPDEVDQYEPWAIREAINNCIAHQDYTLCGRINVVEKDDSLTFTNLGNFVPGDVQRVVMEDAPEEFYRNRFLATAMFNLKMVDTAGGGIRKLFLFQSQRFFPLPDYTLSQQRVMVTLTGKIQDNDYARLLASHLDLTLEETMALDRVQKQLPISEEQIKLLRSKKLIEGRKPNFFVAKPVAQQTGQKAAYSKNKAFDKQYYLDLICKAIGEHDSLNRKEIDELLWSKLPDWMTNEQKGNKVSNLLTELRLGRRIQKTGNTKTSKWISLKDDQVRRF
jgi:ATP-dependent DNA helicase RecG